MKKILLFLFLFILSFFSSFSKNKNQLWGGLEIGYGLSLSDKGNIYDMSRSDGNNMSITTIRGLLGYYITPKVSIGLNLGLNSYAKPTISTVPLMIDIRYHPIQNNFKFFIQGDIGIPLFTSDDDLKGKFTADLSIGYKVLQLKKISIVPSVGYNYLNYSIKDTNFNQKRHSLVLKIGFIY